MKDQYPNIPRLYTALAEWLACMVYIHHCPHRLKKGRLGLAAGICLVLLCVWLEATGELQLVFWIPCMAVAVGFMFLLIAVCCDMPLVSVSYCTTRAFLLAEFIASLEWQLYFYLSYHLLQTSSFLLECGFMAAFYTAAFFIAHYAEKRWKWEYTTGTLQFRALLTPLIIGLTAFLTSNLSFVYTETPFSGTGIFEIYNIRTLVDLAGVALLYSYHVHQGESTLERELTSIRNVLENQFAQYQQSKASIDTINRKYHDLKHQIALLRAEPDAAQRTAFLDEMESEIQAYEAQYKTGNAVLDTILTGKGMICTENHIELTCMVDGKPLDFIQVMDICTLFGNMLDNAIEYEQTVSDIEKRMIHVAVLAQRGFIQIRVENYFQGDLYLRDGLPVTTKAEQDYHGFGIKSIRYTVEKYGGSMSLDTRNGWFIIRLLIPLPE